MFAVELAYDDDPARLAARPAHRERVRQLHSAGRVVMGGPYADDSGALIVFDVASADELDRELAADPYYATGGVTVTSRREWTPVVG